MSRLLATLRRDAVVQYRAGFYWVGAVVVLFYVGLFRALPQDDRISLPLLIPAALTFNVMVTTFYFVAALVLLEKAEGSLTALSVSPLRAGEYLLSKVGTLTFLALVENGLILVLFFGLGFGPWPLLAGLTLLCSLYTLAGFAAISRYDSINEFLIPSVGFAVVMTLPVLEHFGVVPAPLNLLMLLHPVQPALMLMRSAFAEPAVAQLGGDWALAYALVAGILWTGLAYVAAYRAHARLVVRPG